MGTRSITIFTEDIDNPESELCVLYRQYDGYPTGQGKDLKECLSNAKIANGIPMNLDLSNGSKFFNGMGDLILQTVTRLKTIQTRQSKIWADTYRKNKVKGFENDRIGDIEPGGFYLMKAGTRDCWEEFTYTVYPKDEQVFLKVEGYGNELYNGHIDAFDPEAAENRDEDEEEIT